MIFFNPAGPLVATKVPYSLGGGRLGDSGIVFDLANGNVNLIGSAAAGVFIDVAGSSTYGMYRKSGSSLAFNAGSGDRMMIVGATGAILMGTPTDSGNGRLQLASHSALTSGLAFGTVANGSENIWRSAAGALRTAAKLEFDELAGHIYSIQATGGTLEIKDGGTSGILAVSQIRGTTGGPIVLALTGRPTGWGTPTGTLTRTTFATGTVTLPLLAERVAALISDLQNVHGLLGP